METRSAFRPSCLSSFRDLEAIAVDTDRDVYISTDEGEFVCKISAEGNSVEWTYDGHVDTVNAMALDADGNVYSGTNLMDWRLIQVCTVRSRTPGSSPRRTV